MRTKFFLLKPSIREHKWTDLTERFEYFNFYICVLSPLSFQFVYWPIKWDNESFPLKNLLFEVWVFQVFYLWNEHTKLIETKVFLQRPSIWKHKRVNLSDRCRCKLLNFLTSMKDRTKVFFNLCRDYEW